MGEVEIKHSNGKAQGRLFGKMLAAMEAASNEYAADGDLIRDIRQQMYTLKDRLEGAGWIVKASGNTTSLTWVVTPPKED